MQQRSVLLLGATGLVGGNLLQLLLDDDTVARVVVLARRSSGRAGVKIDERIVDLDRMSDAGEAFAVDQIFCALGSTIAKAGSQERFRIIDHDYPLAAARLGLASGAAHFLLVSALGANSRSRIFYNRVKGELEDDLIALGYRSLTIARPSLLLGMRGEPRLGEEIAKRFTWLMPPKYKAIDAATVARALVESARTDDPGVHVLESREMRDRS